MVLVVVAVAPVKAVVVGVALVEGVVEPVVALEEVQVQLIPVAAAVPPVILARSPLVVLAVLALL
jgi:hypothetical protein